MKKMIFKESVTTTKISEKLAERINSEAKLNSEILIKKLDFIVADDFLYFYLLGLWSYSYLLAAWPLAAEGVLSKEILQVINGDSVGLAIGIAYKSFDEKKINEMLNFVQDVSSDICKVDRENRSAPMGSTFWAVSHFGQIYLKDINPLIGLHLAKYVVENALFFKKYLTEIAKSYNVEIK